MDQPQHNGESSLSGYRLLVVEDDYFVAQDLCMTLWEHGATLRGIRTQPRGKLPA